ncbi:MAG: FAD-binding oxidoreductase [Chroococcidiopsidaceae cyanobacterium CP_BM_ER_R8_30]|nr:FAD-binding oxidoreductase [Chroococcidiopsidaceae cyanobacterium CP_BM_ER_R8_30]
MVETADIVVVGGGCIGASIALHLAERKAGKVLLVEKEELANGASGKGIGIIRTHYTHPLLAELAHQSLKLFHQFSERYGGYNSGFNPCGYYVLVGKSDVETLKRVTQMHRSTNINVDLVDLQQVQDVVPRLNLTDVAAAAYEPESGYGSPPQTTRALAKRAADLGVEIRLHCPVQQIKLDSQGQVAGVVMAGGEVATRTVIDCVGPWAKKFIEHLGLEFPVTPVVEHVLVVERPKEFLSNHPVISDLVNLCYSRSDADEPYTRIGNSDPKYHPRFSLHDADEFQGQLFPNITEELHQKLLHRFPILEKGKIVEKYSGIWGVTPDYQPIIDKLEHVPGLYCAVGFSGHGYKLSPIIGDLMSQFVLGENNLLVDKLKLFRLSRFRKNDLIRSPLSYSQAKGLR